jgi:hypothetical protein
MTASPLEQIIEAERRKIEERWGNENYALDPIACLNSGAIKIASKFGPLGQSTPITLELYEHQVEIAQAWIDCDHLAATGELRFRDLADEKSRQMGFTWEEAALIWWTLHFHGCQGGAMHQRLADIDDGGSRSTHKSLFGKVRYIDRHYDHSILPGLEPLVFRTHPSKIESPQTGGVVYGEGQVDDAFRGMTLDYCVMDETAFIEHGELVYASITEACKSGKMLGSTVNGDGTIHARIIDARPKGWTIFRHHWSQHPVYSVGLHVAGEDPKCAMCEGNRQGIHWSAENPQAHRYPGKLTSPWYDEAVLDMTHAQVCRELDIDRAGALAARVYPEFADTHIVPALTLPPRLSAIEIAWDFGTDTTVAVICEDTPAEYLVHGCVELGTDHGTSATASLVAAAIRAFCADALGIDPQFLTPNWTRRWYCVGDPAGGHAATPNSRTEFEEFRKVGFEIQAPPTRLTARAETNIRAVQRLLLGHPKQLLISQATADNFIIHARNNVWPTDAVGNRRIGSTTPYDDVHDHSLRAFAYLVVTKFEPPDEREHQGHDPQDDRDEMLVGDLAYGMAL